MSGPAAHAGGAGVPSRPPLLPASAWARAALVLVLVFAFARGGLWAATTPSFWGPDEDYHFMYVDHVAQKGTIIDPDDPLYSDEYIETTNRTQFNAYGNGPRVDFSGDPKRVLRELANLPPGARDQRHTGRDPAVVHPPLYYYMAAVPDKLSEWFGGGSLPTRMLWVRLLSAAIGALAVYAAWLLASQVLPGRERLQLLVALIVATQPMLAYLSGFVSNDIAVIATFTLVLAYAAFVLRAAPTPRQGLWLGALLTIAALTKSTALVLLPLAAIALLLQRLTYGWNLRALLHTGALAAAPLLVGAAWWYIHTKVAYGTFTGEVLAGGVKSSTAGLDATRPSPGLSGYMTLTRSWLADAYRTGWFHYMTFEAPKGRFVYFAPAVVMLIGALGALGFAWDRRRGLLDRDDARLRQLLVLGLSFALLVGPFLYLDVHRAAGGLGFLVNAGRFVMPAYAAIVVACVLGLSWLVSERARPLAFAALGAGSVAFCWYTWKVHYAERYYGQGSLDELFGRMSFDRPGWVQPGTYWVVLVLLAALLVAFAALLLTRRLPPPGRLSRRSAPSSAADHQS